MIPARKSIVPPRKKADTLQVNRLFDSEDEIRDYLQINFGYGVHIVRTWKVTQFAVEIELPKK